MRIWQLDPVSLTPFYDIHADDVASGLITLALQGAEGVCNIASGRPITIRNLMEMIGDLTGKSDLIAFGVLPYLH